LGGWVFNFRSEAGVVTGVVGTFTTIVGEVAASVVEVVMKDTKQISTGLARMSSMLAEKRHQIGSPCCTVSSRSPLPGAPTVKG
jgi:hypothetical protein